MRLHCVAFGLIWLVTSCNNSATLLSQDSKALPEAKRAVSPVLQPVDDIAGLPRVLLIGDSISMGYTLPTRKLLEGKANVHRIPANGGPTTLGLKSIDKWLGNSKWDVIHFNWGIHDLRHIEEGKRQVEPEEYEKNLRSLVAKLKATKAKLIWAATTPIPRGKLNPDRAFGDEVEYNAIAARVMRDESIAINDLHSYVLPRFTELQRPQDLHYQPEGSDFLAKQVAAEIEKQLLAVP
ncbi:MAG: SGNH/GDSL hydrolase family protein [Pirellulaceae bacterium]|nr:SGNH/GDSL hydrolase family protein [Pirellulaceae bacterium]